MLQPSNSNNNSKQACPEHSGTDTSSYCEVCKGCMYPECEKSAQQVFLLMSTRLLLLLLLLLLRIEDCPKDSKMRSEQSARLTQAIHWALFPMLVEVKGIFKNIRFCANPFFPASRFVLPEVQDRGRAQRPQHFPSLNESHNALNEALKSSM